MHLLVYLSTRAWPIHSGLNRNADSIVAFQLWILPVLILQCTHVTADDWLKVTISNGIHLLEFECKEIIVFENQTGSLSNDLWFGRVVAFYQDQ